MTKCEKQRTVRELVGEIAAEINIAYLQRGEEFDVHALGDFVDIALGTLARHDGKMIVNDPDLPVVPLPKVFPDDQDD